MNNVSPLAGIAVLEIGGGWACALAGKLLMDLGADVSKVELPWGDPLREYGRDEVECRAAFALPNTGKRMLGSAVLSESLHTGSADYDVVLVDSQAVQRLELDLAGVTPDTVVCRLSPFDIRGPLAPMVANDLTLQAMSGVMATTGEAGGRALRAGTELSAVVGALYSAIGVVAALIERERSGRGQLVDISLYDCLVSTLTNFASRVLGGVEPLGLIGNQGPNSAPWELFETADDEFVFIIAGSQPTFTRLANIMGRPDLLEDPRFATHGPRRDHAEQITAIVADWVKTLPSAEIVALLRANGVPISPVASIEQVLTDEHLRSRGLLSSGANAEALSIGQPLGLPRTSAAGDNTAPAPAPTAHASSPVRTRPLDGVRVVDFGTLTAGPFSTRLLANLGADVLKIEPPDGEPGRVMPPIIDDESVFFQISNNGKRSITANLRDPDDIELVAKIIAQADILVSNQAPGNLDKRNLGPDRLLRDAPGLIYTAISGYGSVGPLGGLRAYDTVIQAATGLMTLTGEQDGRPLKNGISTADALGSLASATASLAAYFGRLTGRTTGMHLDMALYDVAAWSTQMAWISTRSVHDPATRRGNGHWLFAPYGTYDTHSGPQVAVACETDSQWRRLAEVLAAAQQTPANFGHWDREQRWQRRAELDTLIAEYCRTRTTTEVIDTLQLNGVPSGPVIDVADVLTTRQELARTTVETSSVNGRSWTVTDFPIRLSATPGVVTSPAPALGGYDHIVRENPDKAWECVFDMKEADSSVGN